MLTSLLKSSSSITDKSLALQILRLVRHDHETWVRVQKSNIPGAGLGVYATSHLARGHVACLYPGVYTPPLPCNAALEDYTYLASYMTPSGLYPSENAYILNLKSVGGYLDGLALQTSATGTNNNKNSKNGTLSPPLHENPSACGHLVNHNQPSKVNVCVLSFFWKDVFQLGQVTELHEYAIPNEYRKDGSPWYFDPSDETIVYFKMDCEKVCGAAMITLKPVALGDELYLDYGLANPYPDWARDWYNSEEM